MPSVLHVSKNCVRLARNCFSSFKPSGVNLTRRIKYAMLILLMLGLIEPYSSHVRLILDAQEPLFLVILLMVLFSLVEFQSWLYCSHNIPLGLARVLQF